MGLMKALFELVGAERRVTIACMLLAGAGLALVAGYYSSSGAPPEAKKPPEPPFDPTGSLALGSFFGEDAAAEEIEQVARRSERGGGEEVAAAEARDAPAESRGVVGKGREVRAEPENALQALSEEPAPPAERPEQPEPDRAPQPASQPAPQPEPERQPEPEPRERAPGPQPQARPEAQPEVQPEARPAAPPQAPLAAASEGVPQDKTLYLTIPAMANVSDTPAYDTAGDDEGALANGTIHLKGTGFPWEAEANVYIAGHRIGYPGTLSDKVFYDLDVLGAGDEVLVEDSEGRSYAYRVFDTSTVGPDELTVANPEPGKNVLTLQTCTLPDYSRRLLVHAERV